MGVSADTYGGILSPVLIKKLPPELRLIVSREAGEEWGLASLMKILEKELVARERAATKETNSRTFKDHSTTASFLSAGRDSNGSAPPCCYCQKGHSPEYCRIVNLVEDLRSTGRCFVCLKRCHISRECRSSQRCIKCGGKHHSSICFRGQTVQSKNTSVTGEAAQPSTSQRHTSSSPGHALTNPTDTNDSRHNFNPSATSFKSPHTTTLIMDRQSSYRQHR